MNRISNQWVIMFVLALSVMAMLVSFNNAGNSSVSVDSANIVNSSIQEEDLKSVDSPIDEQCLTFEESIGDFEWQTCGEGEFNDSRALVYDVQKGSPGTLAVGEVVYITGFDVGANVVEVELADSSSAATMPGIGIMRSEATVSTSGEMVGFGRFIHLDTSAYSEDDALYVSEVAGELTDVAPTGTALVQKFAIVARSHNSDGRIGVVGAGRANALPNLADDSVWLGDATGVPAAAALPDCDANILARLQYDVTTNAFACEQATDLVLPGDLDMNNGDLHNVGNAGTDITSTGATFGVRVNLKGLKGSPLILTDETATGVSVGGELGRTNTNSVSGATQIYQSSASVGSFLIISGTQIDDPNTSFIDVVIMPADSSGLSPTVIASTTSKDGGGAPSARSYTMSGTRTLSLSMASETYKVSVTSLF